ncbi:hypothetical protein EVAR_46256_1 [Eumeta japonica]|uniref:Uncharacterized protein n=1 Tax=Eumeta variegata TaxID=151549 RepID=A0A4C1Y5F1_EUMVA|nr:hypothetical protein EVAR_46256_1 [Eumeta japonica]
MEFVKNFQQTNDRVPITMHGEIIREGYSSHESSFINRLRGTSTLYEDDRWPLSPPDLRKPVDPPRPPARQVQRPRASKYGSATAARGGGSNPTPGFDGGEQIEYSRSSTKMGWLDLCVRLPLAHFPPSIPPTPLDILFLSKRLAMHWPLQGLPIYISNVIRFDGDETSGANLYTKNLKTRVTPPTPQEYSGQTWSVRAGCADTRVEHGDDGDAHKFVAKKRCRGPRLRYAETSFVYAVSYMRMRTQNDNKSA